MGTVVEQLRRRLDRLKALYLEGDLDKRAYQEQREVVLTQPSALPAEAKPDSSGVGECLAAFLTDVGRAWEAATPEEKNRLVRQLLGEVVVTNRAAVAVVPRRELRPFF